MALALFDLDHTLVQADTPRLWFSYLMDIGILPQPETTEKAIQFTEDYRTGNLNFPEYMRFELIPLRQNSLADLNQWRDDFLINCLRPNISNKARALIKKHKNAGDTLVIITATNRFVAECAAIELDVAHLIATEPEFIDEQFTGEFVGTPCFREGKIDKLEEWLATSGFSRYDAWFYSDSANDLPLLEQVTHPVAVNADETLEAIATERNWPILDLEDR